MRTLFLLWSFDDLSRAGGQGKVPKAVAADAKRYRPAAASLLPALDPIDAGLA